MRLSSKIVALCLIGAAAYAQLNYVGRTASTTPPRIGADTNDDWNLMLSTLYDDCVLWFPFNKGDVGVYYDHSRQANDGAQTNASARPIFRSTNGGVYEFDGADDFISIADDPTLDVTATAAISMCAWIKMDFKPSEAARFSIFNKRDGTDAGYELDMSQSTDTRLGMLLEDTAGNVKLSDQDGANIPTNEWHHVALVIDKSADTAIHYLDGVQYEATVDISALTNGLENTVPLAIGADVQNTRFYFDGRIDDTREYDRVLTSNEVFTIHANTTGDH